MATIIQQKTPFNTVCNPSYNAVALFFDTDDKLKSKNYYGCVRPISDSTSIILNPGEVVFGSGCYGITSSSYFQIDTANKNLIFGITNSIVNSTSSVILGGINGKINNSPGSVIMGGYCNIIATQSTYSSIIGGFCNTLSGTSSSSVIIGGFCNDVNCMSDYSVISGGQYNKIYNNKFCTAPYYLCSSSFIGGGGCNTILNCSVDSGIIGGLCNKIDSSPISFISSSSNSCATYAPLTTIMSSDYSTICNGNRSVIIGGSYNYTYQGQTTGIIFSRSSCLGDSEQSALFS